jgi:hypothetical protein
VNDDDKKQDMFKKGLSPELRTLLIPQIYPDFNTLMNKAILTERAKAEERKIINANSWKVRPANRTASKSRGTPTTLHQDLRPQCSIGLSPK